MVSLHKSKEWRNMKNSTKKLLSPYMVLKSEVIKDFSYADI